MDNIKIEYIERKYHGFLGLLCEETIKKALFMGISSPTYFAPMRIICLNEKGNILNLEMSEIINGSVIKDAFFGDKHEN